MAVERRTRAMGTDVTVIVVGSDSHATAALQRLNQLESRWSRFLPDSEVSLLNSAAGQPITVSDDTVTLMLRSRDVWRISAGFVDCTELAAVVDAGYDRPFDQIPWERPRELHVTRPLNLNGPDDIIFDGSSVTLPPGTGFDPGGIGKGLAADIVSGEVMAAGADGVCINLGGDIRVRGTGPAGAGWTIAIEHPHRSEPLTRIGLSDGAVASSTTLRRRWMIGGELRHHLIDPRTGRPATSGFNYVSAIASEGWRAEALAKAVLIRGGPHPFDLVDGTGVEALAVSDDGNVSSTAGFARFTDGVQPVPALGVFHE